MKFTKFFQYAYIVFGILFLLDAVNEYIQNNIIAYPSLLLAGLAIFMFFFRRRFAKKFDNNDNPK